VKWPPTEYILSSPCLITISGAKVICSLEAKEQFCTLFPKYSPMKMKKTSDTYFRIWQTVKRIPKGKVTTYGEIAKRSGFPKQARLVGYALHHLPPGVNIPWHRVVNAQRRISFPPGNENYNRQKALLEREGVIIVKGKILPEKFIGKK